MPVLETAPDATAIRTALWRALHLEVDAKPPVFDDSVGLRLVAPLDAWRERPDMHPEGTKGYRASIVGRARFAEDLILENFHRGVKQCVILGAGLDSFAQRNRVPAGEIEIFEVDQWGTQEWKKRRLAELGMPAIQRFVPVDFEKGERWLEKISAAGFDHRRAATLISTGVSMYLSAEANEATLHEIARFAPGTTFAMTFLLPSSMLPAQERTMHEKVFERARAAGTPFRSFFAPAEIIGLAEAAGFREVRHVARSELVDLYFRGRTDGLMPAEGEEFLVVTTA